MKEQLLQVADWVPRFQEQPETAKTNVSFSQLERIKNTSERYTVFSQWNQTCSIYKSLQLSDEFQDALATYRRSSCPLKIQSVLYIMSTNEGFHMWKVLAQSPYSPIISSWSI